MTKGQKRPQEPVAVTSLSAAAHPDPTTEQESPPEEEPTEKTIQPNQQDPLQNEIRAGWRRALGH